MKIHPVILWTDLLIYILIIVMIVGIAWTRRQKHWREPWSRVGTRKLGMMSLIILIAYGSVCLLDSIHFRITQKHPTQLSYTQNVLSLLDILVYPLGVENEKTYSAPFALYSSAKSTVEKNGVLLTVYPRLIWGGADLKSPQERLSDILTKTVTGLALGFLINFILSTLFVYFFSRHQNLSFDRALKSILLGRTHVAWREVILTCWLIILFICFAIFVAPYYHIFGTDKIGGDVFYETIKSIRTGLIIGTLTTLVMLPFAVLFGTMAGYFGGVRDDIIQYIYTTLSSVPAVLLISAAVLSLQVFIANHPSLFSSLESRADARLLALCIILGITSWTTLCRLVRAETLKLREIDFVKAAVAMGIGDLKITLRHIVPNLMHIILITVVLDFSGLVLAEAVLSYVGVGVDPTTPSWGNMINSARLDLAREPVVWWPLFAAFVFMFALVLAANLFADAVRDAFDPRLKDIT